MVEGVRGLGARAGRQGHGAEECEEEVTSGHGIPGLSSMVKRTCRKERRAVPALSIGKDQVLRYALDDYRSASIASAMAFQSAARATLRSRLVACGHALLMATTNLRFGSMWIDCP